MLRAGQSLPPKGLSTLGSDTEGFPPAPPTCYRASWQLPGPDSHRQADTSLSTWVTCSTSTTSFQVVSAHVCWAHENGTRCDACPE